MATGPWKANVWLSQHTLVTILNLTLYTLFKTSFESFWATSANNKYREKIDILGVETVVEVDRSNKKSKNNNSSYNYSIWLSAAD